MNLKKIILIIMLSLSSNIVIYSSEAIIASQTSIIPFQLLPNPKPMFHLGGLHDSLGMQPITGLQFQPTSNLLLGGVLSQRKLNNNLSIYYNVLIGYMPEWKILKNSSNMIQFGMHRYRFGEHPDARWFSISITEAVKLGSFNFNICWNKLLTQKWERNTILISTRIKLLKNIYCQSGALAYFTPKFSYTPFLFLSILI